MAEFTKGELEIGNTTDHNIIIVARRGKSREYICSIRVKQTGGGAIAEAMEPKRIANAQELVRRWNEYPNLEQQRDDLLAACKRMLGAMACDELNNGRVFDDDLRKEVKEQAEAAIKKAQ